jgi:hypothetical protein
MPGKYGYLPRPMFSPLNTYDLVMDLYWAALDARQRAKRARERRRAPKAGRTLLPGPDAPLWSQLVRYVRPHLRRRGSKNLLAHFLGISRQRLYLCLTRRGAFLDAERTLLLLAWLQARRQGRTLAA